MTDPRDVTDPRRDPRTLQADVDQRLAELTHGLSPEAAALALSVLANRTAARLMQLARTESTTRKAQPDWPAWAALNNAARTLVLQSSTCRDLAIRLSSPPNPP